MHRRTSHFDPSSGVILIEADIHSRITAKARLVFDTGATFCMLPWKFVQEIGLEIDPKETIQTTTASTIETSPIIKIPKMSVLGYEIENVSCIVRDLPPLSGVDGLLGLSFLKHFRIIMDFQKGDLVLMKRKTQELSFKVS
ncbi:clan AA aspartic protease [candidate division WWE3 bacterium]|uniref:Clan AA aspartic protease n=1 Tax=candidate division WWE3 bacterium TaxID=2053526 RepID=A0A955LHK9_UNCKA|nr:clan AA aspartic protease [candidate division WWE3 bacterium]